jgi:twitching motility protein PilT
LTAETVANLVLPHLSTTEQERVLSGLGDVDKTIRHNTSRYRVHAFREQGRVAASIQLVPDRVPTLEETRCGPDKMPVFQKIINQKSGLVIVTGLSGSGKSTMLGAIIEEINRTRDARILLLTDPDDYVFESKQSQITQRTVGEDVPDTACGLRSAFREDVNVIYAGEAQDLTAVALALALAETGHLVFMLMNMGSVSAAIARLIESYPETQQAEIRRNLAATLTAVVAQRLLVRAGGKGRVPAHEVLLSSPHVRRMIADGQTDLRVAIEAGRSDGMQMMDDSLAHRYENGEIDYETAWAQLEDKERIKR